MFQRTIEGIILAIKERFDFCGLHSATNLNNFINKANCIRINHAPSRNAKNNYRYLIDSLLPRFVNVFNHDNYLDYFGASNGVDEFTRYSVFSDILNEAVTKLNNAGYSTTAIPLNTGDTDYAVKLESIYSKDFFLQRKTCMDVLRYILRQFGAFGRNVLLESYENNSGDYLPWEDAISQLQTVYSLGQEFDGFLLIYKSTENNTYFIQYAPVAMYIRKSTLDELMVNNPILTNPQVYQVANSSLFAFEKYLSFDLNTVYTKTYTAYGETITDDFYKLNTPWDAMQLLNLAKNLMTAGSELRYSISGDYRVYQIIDGVNYFQFLDIT